MVTNDRASHESSSQLHLRKGRPLPPLGFLWRHGGRWRWVILGGIVAAGFAVREHPWIALTLLTCVGGLLWCFRNPRCTGTIDRDAVVSPVDGVVDVVAVTNDSANRQGETLRIGIATSVLDTRPIRMPMTGFFEDRGILPDDCCAVRRSSMPAKRHDDEIWLRDAGGLLVRLCHAPSVGRRCRCMTGRSAGQVQAGEVIGMAAFNARIEIWLPIQGGYRATVWRGTRVRGGVSVLARLAAKCSDEVSPDKEVLDRAPVPDQPSGVSKPS